MGPGRMHEPDAALIDAGLAYLRQRLMLADTPLDHSASVDELESLLKGVINDEGNDIASILSLFGEKLAPRVLSTDSPRFLAFIPGAPTKASLIFDAIVSASSMQAISWLEASAAVAMENQTLRWIADKAHMPATAHGVFVSGGTAGNLSALTVARQMGRRRLGDAHARVAVAVSDQAHSSIAQALMVLDMEAVVVHTSAQRLTGSELQAAIAAHTGTPIVAVVATAGTTNAGIVDDLAGVGQVARQHNLWFHVDAAYGGAALLSATEAHRFAGIDQCDSLVTDPHKWWFAPYDCAALIWRDPMQAKAVLTQDASYLDVLHHDDGPINPSDLALHLTRRARGLALWFSLAVYGEKAYREAVQASIDLARWTGEEIRKRPHLELVREPSLSVVMWRRIGWDLDDYKKFQDRLLDDQIGFVTPSSWMGEPIGRLAFLNPNTTAEMVLRILDYTA